MHVHLYQPNNGQLKTYQQFHGGMLHTIPTCDVVLPVSASVLLVCGWRPRTVIRGHMLSLLLSMLHEGVKGGHQA